MKDAIKQSVYLERLKNPIATQKELSIKLGISESMVSRAMKSMIGTHDYQLRQLLAGKFLEEFQMATDYWKLQIKQLEDLKKESDNETVIKLMKEQSDRWEKILFLARQGEAVEIMRLMKNGRVPEISN